MDNGICFKCGGAGKVIGKWKEYTPEYEAKLEARREARRQKYLEEHKEEIEAQRRAEEERQAEIKRQQEEAEAQRQARDILRTKYPNAEIYRPNSKCGLCNKGKIAVVFEPQGIEKI